MKQKKLLTLFLTVATSFSMLVACSNATFAESTDGQETESRWKSGCCKTTFGWFDGFISGTMAGNSWWKISADLDWWLYRVGWWGKCGGSIW